MGENPRIHILMENPLKVTTIIKKYSENIHQLT